MVTTKTALSLLTLDVCMLISGCNKPPAYEHDARSFLARNGVSGGVINRLVRREPLEASEVDALAQYENVAVLHLLAANPSAPEKILRKLAKHSNEEVRTGVASNQTAPLALLLALRSKGLYSTINEHLASNPQVPEDVLYEMYQGREASDRSFVISPNCPVDIMHKVARSRRDIDSGLLPNF
jgi:hypothetical protein